MVHFGQPRLSDLIGNSYVVDAHNRAPAFHERHIPPAPIHASQAFANPYNPESGSLVQGDARLVSGKILACRVQIPLRSEAATSSLRSSRPMPRPRARSATYTLTSATPAYTHRPETGLNAAHPSASPAARASNRQRGKWPAFHRSQSGADFSKVAFPVAMPSR